MESGASGRWATSTPGHRRVGGVRTCWEFAEEAGPESACQVGLRPAACCASRARAEPPSLRTRCPTPVVCADSFPTLAFGWMRAHDRERSRVCFSSLATAWVKLVAAPPFAHERNSRAAFAKRGYASLLRR